MVEGTSLATIAKRRPGSHWGHNKVDPSPVMVYAGISVFSFFQKGVARKQNKPRPKPKTKQTNKQNPKPTNQPTKKQTNKNQEACTLNQLDSVRETREGFEFQLLLQCSSELIALLNRENNQP